MVYDGDKCNALSKSLADTIRSRLKALPFPVTELTISPLLSLSILLHM